MAQSAALAQLQELVVRGCNLNERACELLATTSRLTALTHLDLSENHFGAEGLAWLIAAPTLQPLTSLSLNACALYDEGLELMVTGLQLPALTTIELERNHISSHGAYALAACQWLERMDRVSLSHNPIGWNARLELLSSAEGAIIELEESYDDDYL